MTVVALLKDKRDDTLPLATSDALRRAGFRHALYGGLVLAEFGAPRETRDADFAVLDASLRTPASRRRHCGPELRRHPCLERYLLLGSQQPGRCAARLLVRVYSPRAPANRQMDARRAHPDPALIGGEPPTSWSSDARHVLLGSPLRGFAWRGASE